MGHAGGSGGVEPHIVAGVLADVVGGLARRADFEIVGRRRDYQVIIGHLVGTPEKFVIKLAGADAPHWASAAAFERLPVVSRLLEQHGVRVPRVLAVDTSGKRWPVSYVVTTFLPGTAWAAARQTFGETDRAVLFGELGEVVARVHSIAFDAFGDLEPAGGVRDGSAYAQALAARAARRVGDARRLALFEQQIHQHAAVLSGVVRAAMTHEDLNHYNLLVTRRSGVWHFAALLDLDSAWAGNPESDLAKLELWRGMQHPAFWVTYTAERAIADDYAARRALLQLLWCLEYARPTAEHHAATADVCRELGIPPIRFDA
jgi:aminoglycoside phosphotransferase (APT) family kinase protein